MRQWGNKMPLRKIEIKKRNQEFAAKKEIQYILDNIKHLDAIHQAVFYDVFSKEIEQIKKENGIGKASNSQ